MITAVASTANPTPMTQFKAGFLGWRSQKNPRSRAHPTITATAISRTLRGSACRLRRTARRAKGGSTARLPNVRTPIAVIRRPCHDDRCHGIVCPATGSGEVEATNLFYHDVGGRETSGPGLGHRRGYARRVDDVSLRPGATTLLVKPHQRFKRYTLDVATGHLQPAEGPSRQHEPYLRGFVGPRPHPMMLYRRGRQLFYRCGSNVWDVTGAEATHRHLGIFRSLEFRRAGELIGRCRFVESWMLHRAGTEWHPTLTRSDLDWGVFVQEQVSHPRHAALNAQTWLRLELSHARRRREDPLWPM